MDGGGRRGGGMNGKATEKREMERERAGDRFGAN